MSIIVPSDFKGELTIGGSGGTVGGVSNNLQWFIDKYEAKFLKELLGTVLYAEFIAGLLVDPIDTIWIALRDETDLKQMLLNYVYYYYMQNQASSTSGMSEVKGKTDNATPVNNVTKMIRAWNEMVDMARLFDLSTTDYPDWERICWRDWWYGCDWHLPEIYSYKNSLDF